MPSFPSDGKQHVQQSQRLILRIHWASVAVARIGDCTDIGYQRLNIGFADGVAPSRHECRLVQCGAAMANDGGEIGVADLVERIALSEGVRLDFKIVEVRYTLHRRLGIVAALAVPIVELAAESLLITESALFDCQRDIFS